jgi:glycerate kinase
LLEGCLIVTAIPQRMLIASEPFGPRLDAGQVAQAIARGFLHAGKPQPDLLALVVGRGRPRDVREQLDEAGFDARMRSARAVVIACARLQERALAGSHTFEIATRARQGGVPAYAVTAENALDTFDARILDLQLIIQARSARALAAAGGRLAAL